jgi:hypothetical protein
MPQGWNPDRVCKPRYLVCRPWPVLLAVGDIDSPSKLVSRAMESMRHSVLALRK